MFMRRLGQLGILLCSLVVLSNLVGSTLPPVRVSADGSVPRVYLPVVSKAAYILYSNRSLWESAVSGSVLTEDFEKDQADYGVLDFPYVTGNGFILTAQNVTAQILQDGSLLPSGNLIHMRDWGGGLVISFPNYSSVTAFGFDYRPGETWQLTFNDSVIPLPPGRMGFVGLVFNGNYPNQFVLSFADTGAERGLSVDNISYVIALGWP